MALLRVLALVGLRVTAAAAAAASVFAMCRLGFGRRSVHRSVAARSLLSRICRSGAPPGPPLYPPARRPGAAGAPLVPVSCSSPSHRAPLGTAALPQVRSGRVPPWP